MKPNYLTVFKSLFKTNVFLFSAMVFLLTSVLISCKKEVIDNPSFKIVGNPTVLSVNLDESTTTYEVLSNRPWKVVAVETGDWAKASPSEGVNNGKFNIVVKENKTFEKRVMNFAFVVDGKEELVKLRVEQGSPEASLKVPDAEAGLSVKAEGGTVSIGVQGNVEWKYSIAEGSWLTGDAKSSRQLDLIAAPNKGDKERKATITITSESIPGFSKAVVITQAAPATDPGLDPNTIVKGGNFGAGSEVFWTTVDFVGYEREPYIEIKNGKLILSTAWNGRSAVYQAIKLEAGAQYRLSGLMKNLGGGNDPQYRITLDSAIPKAAETDGQNFNLYFGFHLNTPFDTDLFEQVNSIVGVVDLFTVSETKTYYLSFKVASWGGQSGAAEWDNISITKQ